MSARVVLAALTTTVVLTLPPPAQAEFTTLGVGGAPRAISADGSVIVGGGAGNGFVWEQGIGLTVLEERSNLLVVSNDGRIAAGAVQFRPPGEAVVWTRDRGLVRTGVLGLAKGISPDGSTILVEDQSPPTPPIRVFLWSELTGVKPFHPGTTFPVIDAVTPDFSKIVGTNPSTRQAAFWTEETGLVTITPPPLTDQSRALAVTPDGRSIVGFFDFFDASEAFLWTEEGVLRLGTGAANGSLANAITADGSIIAGSLFFRSGPEFRAALWDSENGWRLVEDLVDVPDGWILRDVFAINSDGTVIAGRATNPSGDSEVWLARIGPAATVVPEPSSLALAALGAAGLLAWRRCGWSNPNRRSII